MSQIRIKLDSFTVSQDANVKLALERICENNQGIVFVVNEDQCVVGCVTDGDIRVAMLKEKAIDIEIQKISDFMNPDFVYILEENVSHELLLKTLDARIKTVPILDSNHCLVNVITKENLSVSDHKSMIIRSKSPVRVSFAGGGTDTSSHLINHKGAVLNATIDLYSHVTLVIRPDKQIILHSLDLDVRETFDNIADLKQRSSLALIKTVFEVISPLYGFELTMRSDVPVGSGLGGSAVLLAAILGAFNLYEGRHLDSYEIAQLAYQAERINGDIQGGWQDQYATVFGGFNFLELNSVENIVHPLRISSDTILELEERLVLCYTGKGHDSGDIHTDQKSNTRSGDTISYAKQMADLTVEMKQKLLKNKLDEFGRLLHKCWELKKKFSNKISNTDLDRIYTQVKKSGALGGKILGAGGGGYFMFYVPSAKRKNVVETIHDLGLNVERFHFTEQGMKAWRVKHEN